jgi:putative glutamine amidotransferase
VNRSLDDFEIGALRHAVSLDLPVLAVCRGHQVLNVAMGGTLVQHLDNFEEHRGVLHSVNVVAGSRVAAAMGTTEPLAMSYHHQAIDRPGTGLRVVATTADGTIEAVEHETATWVVGVQWHPEDTAAEDPANQGLFDALVARARR